MAARPSAAGRLPLNTVASSDGVDVAVYELAGNHRLPPLLISHATGFHGHCYRELAVAVGDRYHAVAFDHRAHGQTRPPQWWEHHVSWLGYADDAGAAARSLAPDGGLVGFGHSMGAASLLISAARDPWLFSRLVLFEPIAAIYDDDFDPEAMPLVIAARRRRRRFASHAEAYANFAAKPPLSLMTPGSLRQYVEHGLRPTPDGDLELCCPPEIEAATFAASIHNGVWSLLPTIEVPTVVVTGVIEPRQPSAWAAPIAGRLVNGELELLAHHTHFGPFSHPNDVAALL